MSTPEYTLYELVSREDNKESQTGHSPYVNKTKADLAILGVPYKSVPLTFIGVRNNLANDTKNDVVTVPTLQLSSGEYITDSFKIAEYLQKHHATEDKSLFPSPDSHASIRFLDFWIDGDLVIAIRELFRPLFWTNLDKASADYFLEFKYGNDQALLDDHLATLGSVEKLNKKAEVAREKLKTLDRLLAEAPNGGPFILGTKPSHADASLWGWYAASQVNAPVINELLWEHPSLPNVAKWVAAAKEATGIKFNFPPAKITPK